MEMTSKERFLTALANKIPDRVPINEFLYSRKIYEEVIGRRPTFYNSEDLFDCAHTLGLDSAVMMLGGFAGMRDAGEEKVDYQDEWQITYHKEDSASWPVDAPVGYPLKNREDWNNYDVPDINKPGRLEQINIAVRKAAEYKMAVIGGLRGPFTPAWLIFGFENFSTLLYEDPDLLDEVLAQITDFYIAGGRMMIEAGVDAILFADDYGSSAGPLMSPRHFRKHIWPQLSRLVNAIHEAGALIIMHSDGDIRKLLPDIVPLGIDAWHPLERHANIDIAEVKKTYGQEIALVGNVDNQHLLVHGSVDEVVAATKECLSIAAPGGGYILGSDHSVHEDMPNENIFAMIETGKKYGTYPIHID
jgi:MtaA/CmuA family methyltransferase